MTPLASFLELMSAYGINGTAALVGGSIALGILLTGCLVPRRRVAAGPKFPALSRAAVSAANPTKPGEERREGMRRGGQPTAIFVADVELAEASRPAWVLDRSTGGLGLLLTEPLTPETEIKVKAAHAPEESPWVALRVRHCRPTDGGYHLGCQFLKTPPWSVLLLFG